MLQVFAVLPCHGQLSVLDNPYRYGTRYSAEQNLASTRERGCIRWNVRQFRQPPSHIVSLWIKFLSLADRIEYPEIGGSVCSGTGTPLPTAIVCSRVTVNQLLHEPSLSLLPVDQKVSSPGMMP